MENIKGEEAVKLFEIVKQNNLLPTEIDQLVPLSFIGQAAVSFYREKINLLDKLGAAEEQRAATLRDGQDAGELLLDIEDLIGALAEAEPRAEAIITKREPNGRVLERTFSKPPKHERLGMSAKKMQQSQIIHKHPEIVKRVKEEARKNEDIATKTAVLTEIKYEKEKERRIKAEENKQPQSKTIVAVEQIEYINALDKCLRILPQKPPKDWNQKTLIEATTKAKIIIKRLEVFNE